MPKAATVVLCGECQVPPLVPEGAKPRDTVRCPQCGALDTVERALAQARRHATHEAARDFQARRIRRGSRVRSYIPTHGPYKTLAWISGIAED